MKNFNLFIPITKIDVAKREVYGIATAEQVDKSGEIMDYETTKPYYKDWSAEIHKASGGKSLGNVRAMHGNVAAGKLTQMVFNDDLKQVEVVAKIVDDAEWKKCEEGVYTGFSHGGEYVKRWKDENDAAVYRYTAKPSEISIVDNPCLGSAVFEMIRADGAKDMVKFKTAEEPKKEEEKPTEPKHEIEQVWKASDGQTFAKKDECKTHQMKIETTGGDTAAQLSALSKMLDDKDGSLAEAKIEAAGEVIKRKDALVKKIDAQAEVAKGYSEAYDCKTALEALCLIECLISGEEWEAMMGEGESTQIASLKTAISSIKAFIASEIMEDEGVDVMVMAADVDGLAKDISEGKLADIEAAKAAVNKFSDAHLKYLKGGARNSKADKAHLSKALTHLDDAKDNHEDVSKAHGKMAAAHEAVTKCFGRLEDCMKMVPWGDLSKIADDSKSDMLPFKKAAEEAAAGMKTTLDEAETHLEKAVKQHGKMGKSHASVGSAHEGIGSSLEAVGAEKEESDEGDDAEKSLKAEMAKLTESVAALTKTNEELVAKNTAAETDKSELQKNFDEVNKLVPALTERVIKLEKTPMPAKGALYDVTALGTAPVSKNHGGASPASPPVEVAPGTNFRRSPEELRQIMGIVPTN